MGRLGCSLDIPRAGAVMLGCDALLCGGRPLGLPFCVGIGVTWFFWGRIVGFKAADWGGLFGWSFVRYHYKQLGFCGETFFAGPGISFFAINGCYLYNTGTYEGFGSGGRCWGVYFYNCSFYHGLCQCHNVACFFSLTVGCMFYEVGELFTQSFFTIYEYCWGT